LVSVFAAGVAQAQPVPPTDPPAPAQADDEVPVIVRRRPDTRAELEALRAQVATLTTRVEALAARPEPAPPPPLPPPRAVEPRAPAAEAIARPLVQPDGVMVPPPGGVTLSGYVQAQHEWSQLSEDQVQQGGVPYNRDRFLVRRARLRVDGSWRWSAVALEIDGSTTRGSFFGLRRAEASWVWRNPRASAPPYLMVTAGLTEIPFGYELPDGVRRRAFMERSLASLAFFPGEPDLGVRVAGGLGPFRYALSLMNGTPLDDRAGSPAGVDPTAAKDIIGRVGVDLRFGEHAGLIAGASFLRGTGFHAGHDATQNTVTWRDINENNAIDAGELTAIPGRGATPSLSFARWAVNLDLGVRFRTRLGLTHLYGEVTLATNLDRSVFVADPIATGFDVRHIAGYVAVTQELFRYGLVGLRFDAYNPNADLLDNRRGRLIPNDQTLYTLSPLVGVVVPRRGRLVLQYDAIFDALARDSRGVPTDLRNNQWTLRAQVDL